MNLELAKRAVACKHWRWMPGMLTACQHRVIDVDGDNVYVHGLDGSGWSSKHIIEKMAPDLEDIATAGCVMYLVRKALEDEWVSCSPAGKRWEIILGKHHSDKVSRLEERIFYSEAEALVVALEVAP